MPAHPLYLPYRWFWTGIDWLYPPSCGGCGKRGWRWCPACNSLAQVVLPPVCLRCGQSQASARLCANCQAALPHYTALRSWAYFDGPVRNAIHALKYKRDISLGEVLSRPMITCLQNQEWTIDMVVPVPMGVERLSQRGYNQAALLAFPLALGLGLPYRPGALQKTRETPSQVGLTVAERRTNVAGAFKAGNDAVLGRCVLLVDDVATSGSTLDECATALLQAGASQVFGLTLARAHRNPEARLYS